MSGFAEGVPTVTVLLDKPRALGFTLGALRRIREALGTLDVELDKPESSIALPTYLWACMSAGDRKELSVEAIEDLIHPGNMADISAALTRLFKASQPEDANPTVAGPAAPAVANN